MSKSFFPKLVLLSSALLLIGCDNGNSLSKDSSSEESSETKLDLQKVECWISNELHFVSDKIYDDPLNSIEMNVTFINESTGTSLKIPAFWNGGANWVVRFALTEEGVWSSLSECSDASNSGLHNKISQFECVVYQGGVDLYKHGFVKTKKGKRYFVYDDDSPFFYLGDTHWTLPVEEIDGIGEVSEEKALKHGIVSQFKTIMDYRKEQGFTVIQSEPLSWYSGRTGNSFFGDASGSVWDYGITDDILAKLEQYDRYFAYIAELGLVHCNATWSYPEELIETYFEGKISDKEIENLTRYWVARYGSYPVMWTTTQEGDCSYYGYNGCTMKNNPWLLVMKSLSKYDAYHHPTTCHQENPYTVDNEKSPFVNSEEHDWFAAQYTVNKYDNGNVNWDYMKFYYDSNKPSVNYEGSYTNYWTGPLGNRAQAYTTYLNGMTGYGYGIQPIWSIVWASYGEHGDFSDSKETYSRDADWIDGLYSSTGDQMIFLKSLLEKYEWWELVPCFDDSDYYDNEGTSNYSVSTIGNDLYLAYFWGSNVQNLGSFRGMASGQYLIQWFNPRSGAIEKSYEVIVSDNSCSVPEKPDSNDWVLVAKKEK